MLVRCGDHGSRLDVAIDDFMTGFLIKNGAAHLGRPAGIAQPPYGSLFVSDDANGLIYRVSWAGNS
jgi:glucose/arabinose dehydrogenase